MADIFISYASADRTIAAKLAEGARRQGWTVWWDRELQIGERFDHTIAAELAAAKCVVVLWTSSSARSTWVLDEASEAVAHNKLVPIALEAKAIPLGFRRHQTAVISSPEEVCLEPFLESLSMAVRRVLSPDPNAPAITTPHRQLQIERALAYASRVRARFSVAARIIQWSAVAVSILILSFVGAVVASDEISRDLRIPGFGVALSSSALLAWRLRRSDHSIAAFIATAAASMWALGANLLWGALAIALIGGCIAYMLRTDA